MSVENGLCGAPRIQGELLKLGFVVAQSTVAKYMTRKGKPSGQSWGTFLRNHAPHIAAMDLFVVPTIGFIQLYVLVIVRLAEIEVRKLTLCETSQHRSENRRTVRQLTEGLRARCTMQSAGHCLREPGEETCVPSSNLF
jgi:hypothetical protein